MTLTPNGTSATGSQHIPYERISSQPENPYAKFISSQSVAIIPSFTLESGVVLKNAPVAYKTIGKLSPEGDNCMVICHALTGSADVADWWGPMIGGQGKAFDISRFFLVCLNSLGSPYGSASPVTNTDGDASLGHYGPDFPLTTVRDDVNIFKLVLDDLGVRQIATVIGGSMGGALVLEFAYFGKEYVRTIIPIATSARYSAWGISWGEAQRQSIYCDPKYDDGYYKFNDPPSSGLGAARMSALLTYRSRDSFESRFGRNIPNPSGRQSINGPQGAPSRRNTGAEHWEIHNDGHKTTGGPRISRGNSVASLVGGVPQEAVVVPDPEFNGNIARMTQKHPALTASKGTPTYFSAQSYLRYQGEKFIKRFDANCYIAITRKLDTHDVSRDREFDTPSKHADPLHNALAHVEQPTLILGIQSDGLFTFAEQQELADYIPNSVLKTIDSTEGHDAFLLEFVQVNNHLSQWLGQQLPDILERNPDKETQKHAEADVAAAGKSVLSEVDDITAW